jgi:penicillin-binding protein 2
LFGLGKKTGIDLPNEAEGLVPSSRWKIRTTREKWYAGETISVAIGQGALTVTPLQLANAIAGLAMGGVWYTPHVVADPARRETPRHVEFKPENLAQVVNGMFGVVNEGGTGRLAQVAGIEVCGKTGTSQLGSNELLKGTRLGQELKDNAWFVGFAPRQNPEIVVVAMVEGGLHGATAAAPVARDLIKTYFEKKSKSATPGLLARGGLSADPKVRER